MADNFAVVSVTLPDDVGNGQTFDAPYPPGTDNSSFDVANTEGVIVILDNSDRYAGSAQVSVAYAAVVTLTNETDVLWRAGQQAMVQLPKVPFYADHVSAIDKNTAVTNAGMAIAPLGAQTPDQAGVDAIVAKVNELVSAYQAAPSP